MIIGCISACSAGVSPAPTSTTEIEPASVEPSVAAPTSQATTTVATLSTTTTEPLAPLSGLSLQVEATDFREPIMMLPLPGSDQNLVVERSGTIRALGETAPWLDISERVNSEDGIEPGLLGMAFHPDFAENGRFFLYYYRHGIEQTTLAEFSAVNGVADPASEITLIDIDKPTNRHNGGMLQFGPDGLLYLSVGEGGKASLNAQNPDTLLGKILRVDVDGGVPYSIPPTNPYREGKAPEVIAIGLRNPWRTWIDFETGLFYIADVGQEDWEEVDVVPIDELPGSNFGWLRMEGSSCFQAGCDPVEEGLTLPVIEYSHVEGCSITGGVVYRGDLIPELNGHYLYADWCSGWVRSFTMSGGTASEPIPWLEDVGQVNGFGIDQEGEVYLLTFDGAIKKLVAVRS